MKERGGGWELAAAQIKKRGMASLLFVPYSFMRLEIVCLPCVRAHVQLKGAFGAFDISGDGSIDSTELKSVLKKLGEE